MLKLLVVRGGNAKKPRHLAMLGLFLMWAGLWAGHQTKVQLVDFIDQLAEAVSAPPNSQFISS